MHRARAGRIAPLRAWIPWIAIFAWYGAMARIGLPALFIVQIAHALQYLIFPFRAEMNRTRRAVSAVTGHHAAFQIMIYLLVVLFGSTWALTSFPSAALVG